MADEKTVEPTGFLALPVTRQLGLIVTLAASIALGAWVFMWSWSPNYTPLYSGLDQKDISEVVSSLQAANIANKIDAASGNVLVDARRLHDARLHLASQGLPKGTGLGVEMLHAEQSFGTSRFVENARYHHAMEIELARTINTMRSVKNSRVHLAIPKQSVFVRDKVPPSASVIINLYAGRVIEDGMVNAIVHLVASSIPELAAKQVTVVDQSGRLLTGGGSGSMASAEHYRFARKLEADLVERIERLLTPIVGAGKVRASVSADVAFLNEESTTEKFSPDRRVRSEQSTESRSFETVEPLGVPGALTNQPPPAGQLVDGAQVDSTPAAGKPLSSSLNSVRNFELDRTISHIRSGGRQLNRLTVAVLVDDNLVAGKKAGEFTRQALKPEEITRISDLVKEAIGFDQARGDRVNVINTTFKPVEEPEALPELSFLDQPWVGSAIKQVVAGIFILILVFTVLKPTVKTLTSYTPPPKLTVTSETQELPPGAEGQRLLEQQRAAGQGGQQLLGSESEEIPLPSDRDEKIEFAKAMVEKDPRRVAKVVKEWVADG